MSLTKEIKERWSPRAFSDKKVTLEDLAPLFEAGRWAASSMNEQPWRFIVATKSDDSDLYEAMLACLVEGNQGWAKEAPALLLTLAKTNFDYKNRPNGHAEFDAGAAAAQIALQATAEGLHTHQMGGFIPEKTIADLAIPEGFKPMAFMAIGYQGNADQLPDGLKERELAPRSRKPVEEIVFKGTFGNTL